MHIKHAHTKPILSEHGPPTWQGRYLLRMMQYIYMTTSSVRLETKTRFVYKLMAFCLQDELVDEGFHPVPDIAHRGYQRRSLLQARVFAM